MFLEGVLISFVVALVRGGRLRDDFGGLRKMWLAPVAFGLQVLNNLVVPSGIQVPITVISYGLLLYFAWLNLKSLGVRLILIGMLLNILVIAVNGGRIPVDLDAARRLGIDVGELATGTMAKHQAMTDTSPLNFLGDVIPLSFPFKRVISVGDIFAVLGVFLLVQDIMGKGLKILRPDKA
jgi:hypothetical protein